VHFATNDSVVDQTDNSLSHVQPAAEEEKPQMTRYIHVAACLLCLLNSCLIMVIMFHCYWLLALESQGNIHKEHPPKIYRFYALPPCLHLALPPVFTLRASAYI